MLSYFMIKSIFTKIQIRHTVQHKTSKMFMLQLKEGYALNNKRIISDLMQLINGQKLTFL